MNFFPKFTTGGLEFRETPGGDRCTRMRREWVDKNWVRRVAGWYLRARGWQTKWSQFKADKFSGQQRNSCFHARRRAPLLHFAAQGIWEYWRWLFGCAVGQLIFGVYWSFIAEFYNLSFKFCLCAGPLGTTSAPEKIWRDCQYSQNFVANKNAKLARSVNMK